MGKNYYPQVILEECKYAIKEKENHNYFTYDVEISSDSDEEIFEKIQTKKDSSEEDSSQEDSDEKIKFFLHT